MHLLSWALLVRRDPADLHRQLEGRTRLGEYVVGIDPAVNRTIDLAIGEGLVVRDGERIVLSAEGHEALSKLKSSGAFEAEQEILLTLPRKVSNGQAVAAVGGAWQR
jgi:hypothetical protein